MKYQQQEKTESMLAQLKFPVVRQTAQVDRGVLLVRRAIPSRRDGTIHLTMRLETGRASSLASRGPLAQ